jgi:DNA mismatch repair protein MutS
MVHLEVQIQKKNGHNHLVYNRKLKEGPGSSMYGIEVAEYILHNPEFIKVANKIRRDILEESQQLMPVNKSKYNSNVYLHKCEVCSKEAEDTHHINFQCNADKDKFIGHVARDAGNNLVGLCKSCHMNVHHPVNGKQIIIRGWLQTSNGKELDYEWKQCDMQSKPIKAKLIKRK